MSIRLNSTKGIFAVTLLSLSITSALAATTYQITPIPLGSVSGINASGMLIGETSEVPVYFDANNQPVYLLASPSGFDAAATDINASGQIIYYDLGATYLWQNGVNTLLGFAANGINDAGAITGGNELGALIYLNGTITQLPGANIPGVGSSTGYAINNLGHVAGTSEGNAALWIDGNRISLGRLPGASDAIGYGVNENDQVVGVSGGRAFLWQNGVMQELPTIAGAIYSYASRINNNGEIVGYAYLPSPNGNGYQSRFLYWKDGVVTDLTLLLSNNGGAIGADINDNGQIAANSLGGFRLSPAAPGADVGVGIYTVTATPGQFKPYEPGQQISYKIDVGNTGSLDASNVVVSDVIPSGLTFISATPSKGSCSFNGTLVCSMGNFSAGARESITFTVLASASGNFTNSASVTMNEADVNSVNNTSSVRSQVAEITADVSLTMTGPSSVKRNSNATYTINVLSGGQYDASNVSLTNALPSGMRFVSVKTDRGTCSGSSTISCNFGNISVGVSAKVTITATATTRGTFTNTATASSTTKDSNTSNNTAKVTTSVN